MGRHATGPPDPRSEAPDAVALDPDGSAGDAASVVRSARVHPDDRIHQWAAVGSDGNGSGPLHARVQTDDALGGDSTSREKSPRAARDRRPPVIGALLGAPPFEQRDLERLDLPVQDLATDRDEGELHRRRPEIDREDALSRQRALRSVAGETRRILLRVPPGSASLLARRLARGSAGLKLSYLSGTGPGYLEGAFDGHVQADEGREGDARRRA